MRIDELRGYILERQTIHERRVRGDPAPWTSDLILQTHKFCCVKRDDDRTSREAREAILALPEKARLAAAMTFRTYNRVSTLRALASEGVFELRGIGVGDKVLPMLENLDMVFNTQAYRIQLTGGLWSLRGLAGVISKGIRAAREGWQPRHTAQLTCASLAGTLGIGPFISYQVMQDLRWLDFSYQDEKTWAHIGPGAWRGLKRLEGTYDLAEERAQVAKGSRGRSVAPSPSEMQQKTLLGKMETILTELPSFMDMFELEHNFCEWEKYERIRTGESKGLSWRAVV